MRVNELSAWGVQGKGDESIGLVSSADLTVQSVNRSGLARTVERLFMSFTADTGGPEEVVQSHEDDDKEKV
jgi:hypothetical protein